MKILIIGAGGREHALAWKLAQSERVRHIIVAPGNGGTANYCQYPPSAKGRKEGAALSIPTFGQYPEGALLPGANYQQLVDFAQEAAIDLIIVGPEAPLADGIVDDFQAKGLKIWGPTRAAAQIEANKAFAKAFMQRHNVPTGDYAAFTNFDMARCYMLEQSEPIVIKAAGLAAGKGVLLPDSPQEAEEALRQLMVEKKFGRAGNEVVIERRLSGPEVSVLAFCDGQSLVPIPPAQDYKRVFDNDAGPNTGGMGAYAPAPVCPPELLDQIVETILQPTLAGLQAEGCPFVGVLYAGLMLTDAGPRVLEFNCRFGDPEAQVILPLLETDLLSIIEHSLAGKLSELDVKWKTGSAATVVLASGGYPGNYDTEKPITGLSKAAAVTGVTIFHAGTKLGQTGRVTTAGGRVLNVTGIGSTLAQALERAYAGVDLIRFEGMHYRTDIGAKAVMSNS